MDCSICLEEMEIYANISVLPCGHQFHSFCYSRYRGYVCPVCRIPNMRKKVDTIMVNNKYLFEWNNRDFSSYIKFVDEKKNLIEEKRKELKEKLEVEKKKRLIDTISSFYFKNLNQIRYNIFRNITNCNDEFVVLYSKFGDTYNEYPLIFLLKGPKDDSLIKGVDFLLQLVSKDFRCFSFFVKNNRGSMCYEVTAKRLPRQDN